MIFVTTRRNSGKRKGGQRRQGREWNRSTKITPVLKIYVKEIYCDDPEVSREEENESAVTSWKPRGDFKKK